MGYRNIKVGNVARNCGVGGDTNAGLTGRNGGAADTITVTGIVFGSVGGDAGTFMRNSVGGNKDLIKVTGRGSSGGSAGGYAGTHLYDITGGGGHSIDISGMDCFPC